MLFGLFFGAGNLIFPIHMGQEAGYNVIQSILGFIITGVGLPLLGVVALGKSKSNGLYDLASRVSKRYSLFFTILLYLTIGPFFALPRCATTSFTVSFDTLLIKSDNNFIYLLLFSALFFSVALYFSLRPGKILVWIGKILNPVFLLFLGILIITALVNSDASIFEIPPEPSYLSTSFLNGFLEGYNTMDALASLAFGVIIVQVIQGLGIEDSDAIAKNTIFAGIFSSILMTVIYILVAITGTKSRAILPLYSNGGSALSEIAYYYLGNIGLFVLALTVTLACLKTSIGLITSLAETFSKIFIKGPSYKIWAITFSLISFVFANFGLNFIISCAKPVLMFLYPLSIVLILLSLFGRFFSYDKDVYRVTTAFTLFSALFDMLFSLPEKLYNYMHIYVIENLIYSVIPFSENGLGWIIPSLIGFIISLTIHIRKIRTDNN